MEIPNQIKSNQIKSDRSWKKVVEGFFLSFSVCGEGKVGCGGVCVCF